MEYGKWLPLTEELRKQIRGDLVLGYFPEGESGESDYFIIRTCYVNRGYD